MTRRVLVATLLVALAAALVGGGTMAWFTAKVDAPVNEFTAGTVLIQAVDVAVGDAGGADDWGPGACREARYTVTNSGSKCAFLRARYEGRWYETACETAMVRMNDDPGNFTHPWPDHPWFTYIIHQPSGESETFYFYAAQHQRAGEVRVWTDGNYLYIEIALDSGFEMDESHVKVATDPDELTAGQGNGLSFGTWPYKKGYDPAVDHDLYDIAWQSEWNDTDLYIAVHGVVCGGERVEWDPAHYDGQGNPVEAVSVRPCDTSWLAGTDGYLYYVGDGVCPLQGVSSGQSVVLCVEICLEGPDIVDDRYRDKTFELDMTFEAVQCSNDAAHEQGWEYTCQDG